MMLADKIIQERKKKGWSQEELAERLDVSRQSVSKWEGGLSVPEIDKIIAMSALFGVTTDYLLKNDATQERSDASVAQEPPLGNTSRAVSLQEVQSYTACVRDVAWKIALGVLLCILSPVSLIELAAFADAGMLSGGLAAALGLLALFAFVAVAVALFVPSGMRLSEYGYVEKADFCLHADAEAWARARLDSYTSGHRAAVTVGTVLCVLGVLPLLVVACIWEEQELLIVSCVGILLATVAVGVFLMVRSSYINGSYQKLLKIGEYTPEKRQHSALMELVSTIYWCVALAIYLSASFLTGAWHITWIVWVIAGVLSPILDIVVGKISKKN